MVGCRDGRVTHTLGCHNFHLEQVQEGDSRGTAWLGFSWPTAAKQCVLRVRCDFSIIVIEHERTAKTEAIF